MTFTETEIETGRAAYEADRAARPNYPDGKPRPAWAALWQVAQWSWTRMPADRGPIGSPRKITGED